ncbi:hypothetical protein [Paenibacillus xylanexedens]|uniref:hypothetical protein n=1 Tax=Paenibacillus xylanexedens TaxID=528191 RepID=UPI0021B4AEB7|nr:hypothetical protein [Paenibacillus xylanexedens]
MVGIGFLAAGFGFSSSLYDQVAHIAVIIKGVTSLVSGILIIHTSASSYHRKRKQINQQTFQATTHLLQFLTIPYSSSDSPWPFYCMYCYSLVNSVHSLNRRHCTLYTGSKAGFRGGNRLMPI